MLTISTPLDKVARLTSLGLKTDLIFQQFTAEIEDRGDYLVVRNPSRPRFFWGNYLIMNNPPSPGDLEKWTGLFEKEIGKRDERGFVAITWDSIDGQKGEVQPFLDSGFELETIVVLTSTHVHKPQKYDQSLVVRPYRSDLDWDRYVDIHFQTDWKYGDGQQQFHEGQRDNIRALTEAGLGIRYGIELDGELVADLGIYWDGNIGRFNNVATHRDFRRRGLCSTLVYEASRRAFEELGMKTLVMQADEDYHAAAIYESIGFKPLERLVTLTWYDPDWKDSREGIL